MKQTAIYLRVSTTQQSTRSQRPDLQRWLDCQDPDKLGEVIWYEDKATGKTMNRPGWTKLQETIDLGRVSRLVVWRLDRLGRTASGLCKLFEDLQDKRVRLISLRDNRDLGTASGRLIAHVLASVAAYETELRGERVRAGQAAAKSAGKTWGGSAKGKLRKATEEQVEAALSMKARGTSISAICRTINLSRPTVYRILHYHKSGILS